MMSVAVLRGMAMTSVPGLTGACPMVRKMIGVVEGFEELQAAGESLQAAPPIK
jgi:hypothetical protein